MKIIICLFLAAVSMGFANPDFSFAVSEYFPVTTGSTWTYNTESLTISGTQQVMKSGTETVEVLADGRFRSLIGLENGNTVDSYNSYVEQAPGLYVSGTVITIKTVDLTVPGWTETTTTNSYAPPLLTFPADTTPGTHLTSASTQSTHLTGTACYYGYCVAMPETDTTSQHSADITVGSVENVTVPAGSFSALKIVTILTVTEDGETSTLTANGWYAPGVGLVKFNSPTLNRELASFSVNQGSGRQLTVTLQGSGGGSVNSDPSGFSCTSGTCSKSYPQGTSITLMATENADSLFDSWGGDCTGNGPCEVTLLSDRTVTATFNAVLPVRMGGTGYPSFQAAFDAVSGDSVVQARSCTVSGDATFGAPWTVRLEGGYDKSFAVRSGETILNGTLNIANGAVVADGISVK